MACGGDVRTIAGGIVVGRMMLLVACLWDRTKNWRDLPFVRGNSSVT